LGPLGLPAHYLLATALHQQKKYPEAIETYQKLISLNPGLFSPYRYMANAYFAMGKVDEAIASLQKALSVKPGDMETRLALGLACVESGHLDEGTAALEEVLRMQPHNAIAAYQVGMVRQSRKDYAAAVTFFRKALAEQPEWPEALNNLAWLLAACPRSEVRDGSQAVTLAERAVKLTSGKEPMFLGTLAASFAEAGRYAEAVDAAGKARALAEAQGNKELARRNGELLELYRAGKAFHEAE
jgi:tetratricopeptide (TPR) repeat protein